MSQKPLGVAIDIGTTTVVLYLIDTETGDRLNVLSEINSQSAHGADVTARIQYCAENGHEELTRLIREQIAEMTTKICKSSNTTPDQIGSISISANTIMQHLAAGLSPVSMGVAPFTPTSLFGEYLPVWEDIPVSDDTMIYYTPGISAYVGGDITSGLLAAGFDDMTETALFIDIGTNGEIVLKHKNTYYCCATAAGPAFEGAEIEKGMIAAPGAIDHVMWNDEKESIDFTVIGEDKPTGLCGSGLLDALAVLLDIEEVDETGRLDGDKYYIAQDEEVYITAGDVRKLQLAKAAIAAGVQVLFHFAGISADEVKMLAVAGGFGSYMDLKSAARIGLFPESMLPIAQAVGNTSGEGAVLTISSEKSIKQLEKIRNACEYIELSSMSFFNDKFIDEMMF